MNKTLRFKIDREAGLADFADFASFATALSAALEETHRRMRPERQTRPRYNVVDLRVGSAEAVIEADSEDASVFDDFFLAIDSIQKGVVPPGPLTSEHVRKYRKLGDVLFSRTDRAVIGSVPITRSFVGRCDELINNAPVGMGDVVGQLQGVNTRRGKRFWVYPEHSKNSAECYVANDQLYDQMMNMFDCRVRLTGKIRHNPDGIGVDRIDVDQAVKLPSGASGTSLASLAGIWKNQPPMDLEDIRSGWDD